jgi:hypothetical protein
LTRLEPSRPAWFLLLALVLNLAGCTAEPGIQVAMTPSTAENVVARLPESIGNFRRGVVTILSDGAAGDGPRGQELAYATADRSLAGFVQVVPQLEPMGEAGLPEALQRFVYDSTANTPSHRRLRERLSVSLPEARPVLRCSELEGNYGRQPVESLACVGVFGGQLVRLRVSHIRREGRMAEVRGFAELVAAALR